MKTKIEINSINNVTVSPTLEGKYSVNFTLTPGREQFYVVENGLPFDSMEKSAATKLIELFLVGPDGLVNVTEKDVENLQSEIRRQVCENFFSNPLVAEMSEEEILELSRQARIRSVQVR